MRRENLFGSRVLMVSGTNVFMLLLVLLTGSLAARLLGPQGRGELAAIQTLPGFFAAVAMLGLPDALVYYSAREPDCAGRFLGSAMALSFLSSFPFMVIGYLVMPLFLAAQSGDVVVAARRYLLLIPIFSFVGMLPNILRGRNDFAGWNVLRTLPTVGWLVVLIMAWLLRRAEPQFVAGNYLVVLALLFFPFIYTVIRRVPGPFWPDVRQWAPMLRYGLPSLASGLPNMLNIRLDQMLMAAFLPSRVLGLYAVAVSWSNAGNPLINAVGSVIFPHIASKNSFEQQTEAFARGIRLGIVVAIIIAVVLIAITPWMIPLLFGEAFSSAIPTALVLVIAGAIKGLNLLIEEGLRGLGHPVSIIWAEFGGLVVTAITLLFLLRPMEIMGAALASVFGYSIVAILLLAQGRQITGYPLTFFLLPTWSELISIWKQFQVLAKTMMTK